MAMMDIPHQPKKNSVGKYIQIYQHNVITATGVTYRKPTVLISPSLEISFMNIHWPPVTLLNT